MNYSQKDNVVEIWKEYDNYHLLKLKNPNFKYQIYDPCFENQPDFVFHFPFLLNFNKKSENHIFGSTILINIDFPFFHNVLENFPMIMSAYEKDKEILVLLNSSIYEINDETNEFFGMNNDKKDHNPWNLEYIKNFLSYFNIKYQCIDSNKIRTISSDYSYVCFSIVNLTSIDIRRNWHPDLYYSTINEFGKKLDWTQIIPNHSEYKTIHTGVKILDKQFAKDKSIDGKKIYVSRKKAQGRNLNIENDIEEYFKNNGYEIIYFEDYSFIDQIKIVKQSKYIVSRHGSGFVNIIFANKYTRVIELHFSELDDPYTYPVPYKNLTSNKLVYNTLIISGSNSEFVINQMDAQIKYLEKNIIPGESYFENLYKHYESEDNII